MGVCASVDMGSSVTKGAADNGSEEALVSFPSVVVPVEAGHPGAIGVDSGWYAVGTDAMRMQREQNTRPQTGAEYHGSDTQRILVCALLRALGVHKQGGVSKLAMGLPYVLTLDADVMGQMTEFCRTFRWRDSDGTEHVVHPDERYLPAQGSGALIKYLASNRHDEARLVLVVDVGGQTTDCVATELGALVGACSQSVGINVYTYFEWLVARIKAEPYAVQRSWDYHDLMDRVRQQRYLVRGNDGRQQNIERCVVQTRHTWTRALQVAVQGNMGSRWPDVERIVLTGGGAALVDTSVWRGPITVMDGYANVQGQHMALRGEN